MITKPGEMIFSKSTAYKYCYYSYIIDIILSIELT